MCDLLFHPNLDLTEADAIAREQGGRLVWSRGRVRLIKGKFHVDAAHVAVLHGDFDAALQHIAAARKQVAELGVKPCSA